MSETIAQRMFEGWAVVDVLGHQRYAGHVTTEYYGQAVFFRVVTPPREPRRRTLERDEWLDRIGSVPKGGTVTEDGKPGGERLIGAGSVYGITPMSQESVFAELNQMDPQVAVAATDPDGTPIERLKPSDDGLPW